MIAADGVVAHGDVTSKLLSGVHVLKMNKYTTCKKNASLLEQN